MSRYRLSRQADADLDSIAEYIARENPDAALHVLEGLHDTLLLLAKNPDLGRLRDDLRPNLRLFPAAQNYVICYYPLKDGIEIATIIHGRRDWAGLFERRQR